MRLRARRFYRRLSQVFGTWPEDPGPFSFASEQRMGPFFADAGFRSVMLEPRGFDLDIACGGGIEEALEAAMAFGPYDAAGPRPGNPCRGCHVDPQRVATLSAR
jgi:hypothetical protein